MILRVLLLLAVICFLSGTSSPVFSTTMTDDRYCGEPRRDASGDIYRSYAVRAAFVRAHPCPVTGQTTGPCPGWQVDHVIPLACGGCDAVNNMQWLPETIKTQKGGKDGFERKIYGGQVPGTACGVPPLEVR